MMPSDVARRAAIGAGVLLAVAVGTVLIGRGRQEVEPGPRAAPVGTAPPPALLEQEVFARDRRTHRGGTGQECILADGRTVRVREAILDGGSVSGGEATLVIAVVLEERVIWKRQLTLTAGAKALSEGGIREALSVRALASSGQTVWIVGTGASEATVEALRVSEDGVETFRRCVLPVDPLDWGRSRRTFERFALEAGPDGARVKVVVGHDADGAEQGIDAECRVAGGAVVVTRVEGRPDPDMLRR